jgi:hypothetical protein
MRTIRRVRLYILRLMFQARLEQFQLAHRRFLAIAKELDNYGQKNVDLWV